MLPSKDLPWPICWDAVELIATRESNKYDAQGRIRAYRDQVGVWTGPYGVTLDVEAGMTWAQAEGEKLFCDTLIKFTDRVKECLTNPPSDEELGAMVSLAYNIGLGWPGTVKPKGAKDGFRQSTVLRQHNAGNHAAASRAFGLWNKAGGVVSAGLAARRAQEAALYLTADAGHMPRHVDPESSIAASPIAQSGVAVSATGAITAAAQYSGDLKTVAENTGIQPLLIIAAVAMAFGLVVVWQRIKQREGGWA